MIQFATIHRLEKSDAGTFGVLLLDGGVFCVTLEPPDLGNASLLSCIPEGEYRCRPVDSPRFGATLEIAGVQGRTHILFHPGNRVRDTHGCVLVGRQFGELEGERAILNSTGTWEELMGRAEGHGFDLRVTDASEV